MASYCCNPAGTVQTSGMAPIVNQSRGTWGLVGSVAAWACMEDPQYVVAAVVVGGRGNDTWSLEGWLSVVLGMT